MGWLFPDDKNTDSLNDKNNWLFSEKDENKSEVQKELDKKKLFDPELFKPTPILNPDGSTLNLGAVKLSDDGSSMVVNDQSTINTLLTPEKPPITNNIDDFDFWLRQNQKKSQLISQGYNLVDIDAQDYYFPEGSQEVKKRNAFDALAEGAKNLDFLPYIGSAIDFAELNNIYNLSQKFDDGTITEEEQEVLYNFVEKNNEQYDNTFLANVVDIVMQTPAFMGEMGTGFLLKEGAKKITKSGLKKILSQKFKNKVKKSYNNKIIKGVTDASLVTVLGAETSGRVQTGTLEKYLNTKYTFDTDELLVLNKEGITYDKAKTRARFDMYVEYMSEQTGGAIKWLASPIKNEIKERLITVGLYKALKKSNPSASAKDIRKIFESLGYHGIIEEMMEERVGEFARGIGYELSKAGVLDDLDDPNFKYKIPSGEQLLTELVAFAVPGGVMKATTKIKDEIELSKVRDTEAYKSLQEARESGEYSEEALDMAEQFIRRNPNIDETTVLKFTGDALTVTKETLSEGGIHNYLVVESGAKDANDLLAREGLDPNTIDNTTPLSIKGETKQIMVDGTAKVLISLSNKADANTVIEEFYGNSYKILNEQDKAVFDEYYNSQDTNMSRQEFFEKEGVKYFNNEGLYKETTIGKVFRKFKQYLQDIFGKANLPKDIRKFYDEAGLGGKVTEKKTSFEISPVGKIAQRLKERKVRKGGEVRVATIKGVRDVIKTLEDPNFDAEGSFEWYRGDYRQSKDYVSKELPEIIDSFEDDMTYNVVLGITSLGTKLEPNYNSAIPATRYYLDNGKFNIVKNAKGNDLLRSKNKEGKDVNLRRPVIAQMLLKYDDLVKKLGKKEATNWLIEKHSGKEIADMMSDLGYNVGGHITKTSDHYGAMIFGPKIGRYIMNLSGIHEQAVYDLWWSRTWNRWMGTPFMTTKGKTDDLQETPRGNLERDKMDKAITNIANKLTEATGYDWGVDQVQAVLWYYEKELYIREGAIPEEGTNYLNLAKARAKREGYYDDATTSKSYTSIKQTKERRDAGQEKDIAGTESRVKKTRDTKKKDPKRSFQLTPEQKEYFKDTKVVDKKGNPKVVYHGTNKQFDRFGDEQFTGSNPFFFTPSPEVATSYANHRLFFGGGNAQIIPVYINLTNPLLLDRNLNDKITNSQFVELIESATRVKIPKDVNIFDYYLADELSSFDSDTRKKAMNEFDKNLFDYFYNNPDIQTYLTSIGYDGIETWEADPSSKGALPISKTEDSTVYISFKPEQIKSVYNKDPKSTGRSFSLEPTYFSTATRAVNKLLQSTQKQIKPQAVKSFLKKNQVKDEEIEFLNLEEYLSNYKPSERIPVEELSQFIKSNEIKITEIERYEDNFVDEDGVDFPLPQDKVARHVDYQLDGEKEDYREITLSIPKLEGPEFIRQEHWEEPNVIASVRMNTRYINNSKVLFIEELQSDLHTKGQKVGYNVPMYRRKDKNMSPEDKLEKAFRQQFEMQPQRLETVGFRPPDAPYKGFDWVSLALKKILRHGAENNFDEIAFINADQVIDRWDLSKRVKFLAYEKRDVKGQPRLTVRGRDINDKSFDFGLLKSPEELERYIGKGVVDKMLKGEGTNPPHLNRKDRKKKETLLEGNDLKIKSRYMIDLYGNQIPQRLKKLTKKFGGRVGKASTVQIDPKQKQFFVSITPKMKEKFVKAQRSFQLEEAKSNIEIPKETTLQYIQRGVQDKLNRLEQIQKKIGVDQDELDAYMKADLFTSKATARIDKVNDWLIDGKGSFLVRLQEEGFTLDDLAEYMYAKHAKERNKHIKDTINPENEFGSGMTNKEANEILKSYDKKIEKFAKEFRTEVIDKRLDVLRDSGLIDEDAYNLFTSGEIFKNYVPLKGNASGQSIPMTGKGYNVTGKDIKRIRRGRSSRAENPVIQSIVDLNESIIRAEKNTIGKSLIKLIQENQDVVLDNGEKLWEAKGLKYLPRYDSNGEVEFMDPSRLQQNQLMYWDDGKAKVVTINDPALYEGLANVGMGRGIPVLNQLNNYLRLINTSLNPEFMITNFQRDVQTATLQLSTNQSNKIAKKTAMTLPKAMKGIFDYLVLKKESKWSKAYEDFIDQGGKIGWIDQGTVEQKEKDLKKKLDRYTNTNNLKLGIQSVANFVDDINTVVESGTRLSAYQNLIESGVSKEKASQIAKNMTVNFNKKGQWGSALNTFYLFFNASVQGGFNILKTLTSQKGQAIAGGLAVAGFVNSYINRAMDEDEWDEVNDYDKDTKWLFKYPGMKGYIPIMLPYGYNVFVATGRIVEEMTFGEMLPYQAYSRMLNAVDNAFNPIGGGTIFQMLAPTVLDLPTQILEGKNWAGQPYKPEQAPYGRKKPQSELYYDSARKTSIDIAKKLNELTGGNARVQGKLSFSPEDIDLVTDFATGGTGRFLANSFETGKMIIQDKELPDIKNIPIARKFYVKKSEFKSKSIAYDLLERSETKKLTDYEIGVFKRRVKMAKDAGALSEEQSEKMLQDLDKNIKYINAPQQEIDTVEKIDKMYKELKQNKLSQKDMDVLYDLVDDAEYNEYITKQKMRRIQKAIERKEK